MAERHSIAQKHTSGKAPRCVRCALLPVHKRVTVAARSPRPRARRNSQPAWLAAHIALVDTSVYLKPVELINVALDVLTRLTPCLKLGVRKFRHKDLLDTVGAKNCRK